MTSIQFTRPTRGKRKGISRFNSIASRLTRSEFLPPNVNRYVSVNLVFKSPFKYPKQETFKARYLIKRVSPATIQWDKFFVLLTSHPIEKILDHFPQSPADDLVHQTQLRETTGYHSPMTFYEDVQQQMLRFQGTLDLLSSETGQYQSGIDQLVSTNTHWQFPTNNQSIQGTSGGSLPPTQAGNCSEFFLPSSNGSLLLLAVSDNVFSPPESIASSGYMSLPSHGEWDVYVALPNPQIFTTLVASNIIPIRPFQI